MVRKALFWIFCFTMIMVVAVWYLFRSEPVELSFWGLPTWLYGIIFIELIYSLIMFFFMKKYWKADSEIKQS